MDTNQFDTEFTNMPLVSPSSLSAAPLAVGSDTATGKGAFEGFTFVAPHQLTAHRPRVAGGAANHSPTSQASLHAQAQVAALAEAAARAHMGGAERRGAGGGMDVG